MKQHPHAILSTFFTALTVLPTLIGCQPEHTAATYNRLLATSAVHAHLLMELGANDCLAGVCDAAYVVDSALRKELTNGRLEDFGSVMSPSGERILAAGVDGILLSSVEGLDNSAFTQLHIPIIASDDYMESTPLLRAKWMTRYGELVGRREAADSLYKQVESRYSALRDSISQSRSAHKFVALTDLPSEGGWYFPGGGSYLASLYRDAGYELLFADSNSASGSVLHSLEAVIAQGGRDANIWFIKYAAPTNLSYTYLRQQYPWIESFRAYQERQIYGCNTLYVPYYEMAPFHPDQLLQDIATHNGLFYSPLSEK